MNTRKKVVNKAYKEQQNRFQENKPHKCPYEGCGAVFPRPYRFKAHLNRHTGKRPFKCEVKGCTRAYVSSMHLKRHMKSHKRAAYTETYRCPEKDCAMEFLYVQNVQKHILRKHVRKRPYPCSKCEKSFLKHDQLRSHEFEHTGVPPFRCEFCNVGFTNTYQLRRHHRGHKKFTCDECGKEFIGGSQFRKHYAQKHPPRYTCASCGKEFYNKALLTEHVAAHLITREVFRCPFKSCSRFYYHKRNVDYHVRTFHEESKPKAVCQICGTELFNKQKLKHHIETIHGRKAENVIHVKNVRKKRKDAGKPRLPLASQLTGIDMPLTLSENLLNQENVALDLPSSIATLKTDPGEFTRKQPVVVLERIKLPHRNVGTPSKEAAEENLNGNLLERLRVPEGEKNHDGGELKNRVSFQPKKIKLSLNEKRNPVSQDKENIRINTRSSRKILLDSGNIESVYECGLIRKCLVAENLNLSQASDSLSNADTAINVAPSCTGTQNIRNYLCCKEASPSSPLSSFDLDPESSRRDVSNTSHIDVMPMIDSKAKIMEQNKIDGVDGSSSISVKSKIVRSSVIPVPRKSGCRKRKKKHSKPPSVISSINQTDVDMLAVSIQQFSFQKTLESACHVNSKMSEDGCKNLNTLLSEDRRETEFQNVLPMGLKEDHIQSHSCSRLLPQTSHKISSVQQKRVSSSLKASLRSSKYNKDYVDSRGTSVGSDRKAFKNSTRSHEYGNTPVCDGSTLNIDKNIGQSADKDDYVGDLGLSVSAQKLGLPLTENTGNMKRDNIRVRKDLQSNVGSFESVSEQLSDSSLNDNKVCDSTSEAVEPSTENGQLSNSYVNSSKDGDTGNENELDKEHEVGKECMSNSHISGTNTERDSNSILAAHRVSKRGSNVSNNVKRKPSIAGEEGRRLSMSIHTWLSLMKEAMTTEIPDVCKED